jgi:hypothetical protein
MFIQLNAKQINRLSEFLGNLSILLIGSLVIPYFLNSLGLEFETFLLAISTSVASFSISLLLLEGGGKSDRN